jgi:serine protease Do
MSAGTLLPLNERHVKSPMHPAPVTGLAASDRPDRRLHSAPRMMMAGRRLFAGAGLGFALAFTGSAAAQPGTAPGRLPSLPDTDGVSDGDAAQAPSETRATPPPSDAAGPSAAVPLAAMSPRQLYEHVRRGVVVIERGGMPAALGTVLAGDGRVLTALSGLAGAAAGTTVDVRYADGTAVHAKVAYTDPSVDLALLAPVTPDAGHRTEATRAEGLTASESDPATTLIRAMLPGRVGHIGPANVGVKGPAEAHARDGAPLLRMLDVDVQGIPVVGAPLLDPAGNVVAVLVRACKGLAHIETPAPLPGAWPGSTPAPRAQAPSDAACQPVLVGASIATVRSFLSKMMTSAAATSEAGATGPTVAGAAGGAGATGPWLGIRGEPEDAGGMHGVRVVDVAPSSPAEKAGLKPGVDVIVAVDGRPIDRPDALGESISKHATGDSVKLLVFGGGKFREVTTVLRAAR